jgi:hypothetical protein
MGSSRAPALRLPAITAAPALGCARLSLTTDRWLAWNAPFYARHGFAEVAAHDPALPEWLAGLPAHAAAGGLDPARRCIMVRSA